MFTFYIYILCLALRFMFTGNVYGLYLHFMFTFYDYGLHLRFMFTFTVYVALPLCYIYIIKVTICSDIAAIRMKKFAVKIGN